MKLAEIENGLVSNIILAEGEIQGYIPCPEAVQIGWSYENEQFEAPQKSLEEIKRSTRLQIYRLMDSARLRLSDHATPLKLTHWNDKAQRASRILADTATEADRQILQAELHARARDEETLQSLAQAQKTKAEALARKMATLSGLEKKALHDLEGKQTENTITILLQTLQRQIETIQ